MQVVATAAVASDVAGEHRVLIALHPAHAPALRDYFLRLGLDARVEPDATVTVDDSRLIAAGETLAAYIGTWVEGNGVHASIVTAAEQAAEPEAAPAAPVPRAAATSDTPPPRLGELLVTRGLITPEQLTQALRETKETGRLLGQVLLRHRWVFEDELARALAGQWSIPYVDLISVGVDAGAMRLLPMQVGLDVSAIPVRFTGTGVLVAFADPSDEIALRAVAAHIPDPELAVAEDAHIRVTWRRVAGRR